MEVIPGVFQIRTMASNLYLIVENGEMTLIDAGTRGAIKPLLRKIHQLGIPLAKLKRVLLTHSDMDHVGVVNALRGWICPEICASRIEAEALAGGHASRSLQIPGLREMSGWLQAHLSTSMRIEVDRLLSPGETLPVLGGLEVVDAEGHTPGQVAFFAREKGLLFSGDAFRTRAGGIDYNLVKAFTWDAELVKATHKKLAGLKPEIVCGGHGPVVYGAAGKFVD